MSKNIEYRVVQVKDVDLASAEKVGWHCASEYHLGEPWARDSQWDSGVIRFEDGVPVEFVGEDGGEPEDQTLFRDWKWVAPALQAAYERGLNERTNDDR